MNNKPDTIDEQRFVREQNEYCSAMFLQTLIDVHGAETVKPAIEEPEEPPAPLPPIPNELIAKAAEQTFPKFLNRIAEVQHAVLKEFPGLTKADLLSIRRKKRIVLARQVGMYVCRQVTNKSFPEIGRRYGGRDHTTVLHAVAKIEKMLPNNPELAALVSRIEDTVGALHED